MPESPRGPERSIGYRLRLLQDGRRIAISKVTSLSDRLSRRLGLQLPNRLEVVADGRDLDTGAQVRWELRLRLVAAVMPWP